MAEASFLGSLTKKQRDELILNLHNLQHGRCYISGEPIDLSVHPVDLDQSDNQPQGLGGKPETSSDRSRVHTKKGF